MQATASTTRKPRAPALPQPIPLANIDTDKHQDTFWAAVTLNDDAELQAIVQMRNSATRTTLPTAAQNALSSAARYIRESRDEAAQMCKDAGGLLFAFHGSKAFGGVAA
jgi:hypothetical protein